MCTVMQAPVRKHLCGVLALRTFNPRLYIYRLSLYIRLTLAAPRATRIESARRPAPPLRSRVC